MAIKSSFLYSQAVGAGLPFWRLQIDNWGNRGAAADADSIAYTKPMKDSASAIVIGPDSTVDEVIINYNVVLPTNPPNPVFGPGQQRNQDSMTIGIKRPGLRLPGPLGVRTAFSTQFTDLYNKDGLAANLPFGTAEPLFEAPELQLLVYPTPPVTLFPKRNDMYRNRQTLVDGVVGTEELIGIWPVMGRSCKSLYFKATNTGDLVATIRVGGIVDIVTTQAGVPTPFQVEKTVNTATLTVNATTGVTAQCTTGRPMQWIAAYVTRVSGTGFLDTVLLAEDC